jgi:hypothetical protein
VGVLGQQTEALAGHVRERDAVQQALLEVAFDLAVDARAHAEALQLASPEKAVLEDVAFEQRDPEIFGLGTDEAGVRRLYMMFSLASNSRMSEPSTMGERSKLSRLKNS